MLKNGRTTVLITVQSGNVAINLREKTNNSKNHGHNRIKAVIIQAPDSNDPLDYLGTYRVGARQAMRWLGGR